MDTAPDKAPEEAESQTFSNSTDATPDLTDKTNPKRLLSQPSVLAESPESPTEQNEVTITAINHHDVFHNTYLIKEIIPHLLSEPWALRKIMTVCKFFEKECGKALWAHADPRTLISHVPDARRQAEYAALIRHVKFLDHHMIWPAPVNSCPQFPEIRTLQIYNTSLFASSSSQLRLFLSPELQELCIWIAPGQAHQVADPRGDIIWLSHLAIKCLNLEVLQLEISLDITSIQLTSFLGGMQQLKTLHLGPELNAVLENDALTAILTLPQLEHLSLSMPLNIEFLADFLATKHTYEILPRAKMLDIKFLDSECLAADFLRACSHNLQQLEITLLSTIPIQVASLHAALMPTITKFPQLRSFSLTLSSKLVLSISDLQAITSCRKLAWAMGMSSDREFEPKAVLLRPTARSLIDASISARLLEALELVDVQAPIMVTYHEAVQITAKIGSISPDHLSLFNLILDEEQEFGWPSVADYETHLEDPTTKNSIWQASMKAFAPDPVPWVERDLNAFCDRDGQNLALDQVATGGTFNQFASN